MWIFDISWKYLMEIQHWLLGNLNNINNNLNMGTLN